MKWWERPVRMMRLDWGHEPQRIQASDLDTLARSKKEEWHINCEWVIGTPGIAPGLGYQTTFNTPLFEKYPALGEWDAIRSYLPHARKYGIHVLAYLNMHWYDYRFGDKKTSWQQRTQEGRAYGEVAPLYGSGTTFCVNTPWREWAYDLIREAMKTGIEGVFLDGPVIFPGCCYCDLCKEKFKERTGHEPPSFGDWNHELWKEFIIFREDSMADFLSGAQEAMREINPEGVIFLNAGSWHGGGWRVARNIEKVGTYQNFNGAESFFHPGPFEQIPIPWAITAKHLMAGGKPAVVFSHHMLGPWHYLPLPEIEERLSIAQTVANGANPWFAVFDQALDFSREEALRPVRELNSFLEKNEEYYTATESAAEVAVLYSTQSSVFYLSEEEKIYTEGGSGQEQNLIADVSVARALNFEKRKQLCEEMQNRDFWGACYLLTRGHLPYDVILDNQLTDQALARYRVLVLPNSACLSDEQASAIERFVLQGGGLVADFETGRYDANGTLRPDHPLAKVFGIAKVEGAMEPVVFDEYVKVKAQHKVTESFNDQQLLARPLYCLKIQPLAADKLGENHAVPLVFMNPTGNVYSPLKGESAFPATIVREYGEGRVVYFPHLLSDMYTRYKIGEHEKWYTNSILWAYKDKMPLEIISSPTVEIEVRKQVYANKERERFLIHLINNTGDMQRPISELVPIQNLEIFFRSFRPEKIYSLSSGENLNFDRIEKCSEDSVYRVIVPELSVYEVLVVEVLSHENE